MKPIMILGIVLLILGVAALVFPVITYTTREPVNFFGLQFTAEKQNTILLPGIVGVLAFVGGVVIVVAASRKAA